MSRFSGLPDPLANQSAKPGARFAGLKDALGTVTPENGTRAARIRAERAARDEAAARGETILETIHHRDALMGREPAGSIAEHVARQKGSHRSMGLETRASNAVNSPAAKTPAPKAATTAPHRKLGRTEIVALAVRTDPKLKGMEDIALHMLDDPDLKGLSGDGVVRCMTGIDANKYRAAMAEEERKARVAKADAVWERARASIDGRPATTPKESGSKPDARTRSDAIWEKAFAAIGGRK